MKRTAEFSQPPVLFLLNAGQRCKARVVAQEFASTSRPAECMIAADQAINKPFAVALFLLWSD